MRVSVQDLQTHPIDTGPVRRAAERAAEVRDHGFAEVTVALVDDGRITDLNRAHRDRDRPTDVLSYEGDQQDPTYMGDVLISVDTACRQAEEAGRTPQDEVAWLVVHGVLHLLGYDDALDAEREEMIRIQDRILREVLAEEGTTP